MTTKNLINLNIVSHYYRNTIYLPTNNELCLNKIKINLHPDMTKTNETILGLNSESTKKNLKF